MTYSVNDRGVLKEEKRTPSLSSCKRTYDLQINTSDEPLETCGR